MVGTALESGDYPMSGCPKCGVLRVDMDGFGVLYCESCKWCAHPAWTGDGESMRCEFCGLTQRNRF